MFWGGLSLFTCPRLSPLSCLLCGHPLHVSRDVARSAPLPLCCHVIWPYGLIRPSPPWPAVVFMPRSLSGRRTAVPWLLATTHVAWLCGRPAAAGSCAPCASCLACTGTSAWPATSATSALRVRGRRPASRPSWSQGSRHSPGTPWLTRHVHPCCLLQMI